MPLPLSRPARLLPPPLHSQARGGRADEGGEEEDEEDGAALSPDVVPQLPDPAKYPTPGILPRVIRTLVERRREVKKLLKTEKDPVTAKQLDIRQAWAVPQCHRASLGWRGACMSGWVRQRLTHTHRHPAIC
jgi:hypothetical protein